MKIASNFRCRFGRRFFTQKSIRGSKMMPQASKIYPKIDEKSIPEAALADFGETLIFDDSIMVLLVFSGPGDLENHQKSIKNSLLQRCVPKSLQNRRPDPLFIEIFRNILQKRPPKASRNPLKIIENPALVPKGAARRPRTSPWIPKVYKKLPKWTPSRYQKRRKMLIPDTRYSKFLYLSLIHI